MTIVPLHDLMTLFKWLFYFSVAPFTTKNRFDVVEEEVWKGLPFRRPVQFITYSYKLVALEVHTNHGPNLAKSRLPKRLFGIFSR